MRATYIGEFCKGFDTCIREINTGCLHSLVITNPKIRSSAYWGISFLKLNIINREFVDFKNLFPTPGGEPLLTVLTVVQADNIELQQATLNKTPITIDQ